MKVNWAAWGFVAPALLVIAVFFLLPELAGLALSFTDFEIYALADIRNLRFVGLANYAQLLQTPLFWSALGNTLYFVGVGVPLSIATSLGAALLLNSKLARLRPFFRTALFAPVVTTLVAVAIVWRYLLHTRSGLVNYGLQAIGLPAIDWLGEHLHSLGRKFPPQETLRRATGSTIDTRPYLEYLRRKYEAPVAA